MRPQSVTVVDEGQLHLPIFYDTLKTLSQTVEVDYFLPGCPPEAPRIWEAIEAVLTGKLPPPGSVIGLDTTVCDACPRMRTQQKIKQFKRTWEVQPDPGICLLERGLICCGIATRGGCDCRCPRVNSPCIGCYGLNENVEDYGARLLSALAPVIDSDDPAEIERIITQGMPDPIGTLYRFSLAGNNHVNFYDGLLRVVAPNGTERFKYDPQDYRQYVAERVETWSYLKFPYLKKVGWCGFVDGNDSGVYRCTPLSRLNAADGMATPLAQAEYERYFDVLGAKPVRATLATVD